MLKKLLVLILVFILGALSTQIYAGFGFEQPAPLIIGEPGPEEQASPYDWVKESQIKVYNDRIILEIPNAVWAAFTNTNSMDPVIDEFANAIEIIPKSAEDIHVGDIVSYQSDYADGSIIHRIVFEGEDAQGTYFLLKGDNNHGVDPGKIRFEQIKRVLVAVIY